MVRFVRRSALFGTSTLVLASVLAFPAAAQQASTISPAPADETPDIIVTGQRAAEQASIRQKRGADSVTEVIVADDVGKLPDQNVAESVRRLPGLSVANDQGEGRYVIIRGVNPNLVNVTVNGQTQPAPEPDGRQVKLDDIPSSLIQAVTISKSLTPDQDANAIGGAVDIRTLSAFDRKEHLFGSLRGQVGRYELNHKYPWEVDGLVGGRFGAGGQFGAVLSGSYSRRPIESENFQGTTNFNALGQPDQYGLRDYNLVRTRVGLVGNFDWHPTPALKLFLRATYSQFKDNEARDQNRVDSLAYPAATPGTFTGRGSILIRRRIEDDNTKSLSGGGSFKFAGGSQLDIVGAYARAIKNDPLRSEFNFRTSSTTAITGTYNLATSPYLFTLSAPFNPANFPLNSVNYDKRHAQEDLWQVRADYTVPLGFGDGSTIKLGAKYLNRQKFNNRDYSQYGRTGTFNASAASYTGDTNFYDGAYAFGPRIDYDAAQAYATANPVLTQSAANLTTTTNNSLVNDYLVREEIVAGYVMATLKFAGFTVTPGVRIESTTDRTSAKVITAGTTPTQDYNSFGHKAYTYAFPGINVKYDATSDLVVRAAITTALGRPNYPDLSSYVSIDQTTSPVTVTKGNPDLTPYKAVNYDFALEYYLPNKGILSIGLFNKSIDNPIYTQSIATTNGTFAGQTFALANVVQPVNARSAVIRGIEFNAQYQFTFLPGALSGFGVAGNFTIVDGHGSGLPNRTDGEFPLFFQSKRVGSAQLTYEKYGITGRVAYSYRSAYLDTIGTSKATDQYTDDNGQIDARVSYDITRNINVYVEGTNLNDAPWRRYIGTPNQLVERERYDSAYRIGAQIKF